MAQSRRVKRERYNKGARPLDDAGLERLALFYVGRYATTRARVRTYLLRKLRERGWAADAPSLLAHETDAIDPGAIAKVNGLVERLAGLGYVDDAVFASARAQSLHRRGYGDHRIAQALAGAGISSEDAAAALQSSPESALEAALLFAKRRRFGPFAATTPDRPAREKAFAAMMRAGHSANIVRTVLDMPSGQDPA